MGIRRSVWIWFCEHVLYYPVMINHAVLHRNYTLGQKELRYLVMPQSFYPNLGERAVEIPYALEFLRANQKKKVLEVGNVMQGYTQIDVKNHKVIDKYEKGKNVTNTDIIGLKDVKKYDVVLSISTMEHVGYDEPKKERGKTTSAMIKMAKALKPGGIMLITVPLGYNPEIDDVVKKNKIKFYEMHFMKRVSALNSWAETTLEDALGRQYGVRWPAACAVAFLIYRA